MEDYRIDIRLSEGPKAQTITMPIEKFTLIGATTRLGMLTPPMRARFGIEMRLTVYPPADLLQIVHRTAEVMQVKIDDEGAKEIAKRSRGTPRVANRLLRRIRDFAQVRAGGSIDRKVAADALQLLEVDQFGLDDMDSRILKTIIEKFDGGPVGVGTIAAAVGGCWHARGGLRAVPGSERLPPAHSAGPRGDGAGVQALRIQPAECNKWLSAADVVLDCNRRGTPRTRRGKEGGPMRHSVSIVLGALSGAFVVTATPPLGPPAVHAQTNWREVRSLKMGRFRTRIEVSSARTVRLYSQLDTSRLTDPVSARLRQSVAQRVSELDKPTRMQYVRERDSSNMPPTVRRSGTCSRSRHEASRARWLPTSMEWRSFSISRQGCGGCDDAH